MVWRRRPKVEPAADCVKGCPGWSRFVPTPSALFNIEDGLAKFVKLKR